MASSTPASAALGQAQRLVVKVGSSLLIGPDGAPATDWLAALCGDLAQLKAGGKEIAVVTSGAVAIGRRRLGLAGRLRLDEKQAASAAGQAQLIEAWQSAFAPHGIIVAQVLLTLSDTEDRRRYLNARATFGTLMELGAVPVVNENDAVATAELRYGDNDRLAAHAAALCGADLLLILSDVDGLYTADPRLDPAATRLAVVESVNPDIERLAGGPNAAAGVGSGGMATKVAAAKIAGAAGCAAIVAPGAGPEPLSRLAAGGPASLFRARTNPDGARKRWIGGRLKASGAVQVDAGAARAVRAGASLLPAGIVAVDGRFARGDAVSVLGPDGALIGQGLVAFDRDELDRIKGLRSDAVEGILGHRRRDAAIDRDNLALAGDGGESS